VERPFTSRSQPHSSCSYARRLSQFRSGVFAKARVFFSPGRYTNTGFPKPTSRSLPPPPQHTFFERKLLPSPPSGISSKLFFFLVFIETLFCGGCPRVLEQTWALLCLRNWVSIPPPSCPGPFAPTPFSLCWPNPFYFLRVWNRVGYF